MQIRRELEESDFPIEHIFIACVRLKAQSPLYFTKHFVKTLPSVGFEEVSSAVKYLMELKNNRKAASSTNNMTFRILMMNFRGALS